MSAMEGYELRTQGAAHREPVLYEPGSCAKCPFWSEAPTGGIGVCGCDTLIRVNGPTDTCCVDIAWTYPTDGEGCEVEA